MSWRQILAENKAVLIERGVTPLGEKFIRRQFLVPKKFKDTCITNLRTYTSASNSAESSFITSPLVDGEIQAGTWYGGIIVEKFDTPDPSDNRVEPTVVLVQMLIAGLTAAVASPVVVERTCAFYVQRTEYRSLTTFPTLPAAAAGVTYRFVDARLDDETGMWRGFLETRTAISQSVAAYLARIDQFLTLQNREEMAISDAAAAALIPSTQTAGTRVTADLERRPDCLVDLSLRTETAHAVTDAETVATEAGDVDVAINRKSQQTAAEPAPTQAPGEVRTVINRKTEFQRYDVETRTETRNDQSIAAPEAYTAAGNVSRTRNELRLTAIIAGAAAAPAPLAEGEYGVVSYEKDRFDRYNGIRSLITYLEEATIAGWEIVTEKITLTHPQQVQRGKKFYVRYITYDCYISQRSSRALAYSEAHDARTIDTVSYPALQGTEVGSSRVEVLRNGQYRAFWIGHRQVGSWMADGSDLPI